MTASEDEIEQGVDYTSGVAEETKESSHAMPDLEPELTSEPGLALEQEAIPVNNGTILEAAFVDPAYATLGEGEGKYAVELKASSPRAQSHVTATTTTTTTTKKGLFGCCKSNDTVETHSSQTTPAIRRKQLDRERRHKEKYARVPEGILIYRLDTSAHTIDLVSKPSANTNLDQIVTTMVVARATPSHDATRRALELTGIDGTTVTLVACEQRTAIAWVEAIDMMLASKSRRKSAAQGNKVVKTQKSRAWGKESMSEKERDHVESQYVNLAAYSNKLIRAGAVPGQKKGEKGTSIYYNVDRVHAMQDPTDGYEDEALESIAKRRAVIKDSWDFYRMICSLLRDRRKYDEVFRKLQHDPVYPYLNSMTGLNDPGDAVEEDKQVIQNDLTEYASMSKSQVAAELVRKASDALPSLVEICKALAGSLGMEEVGVGPIKEAAAAIRKADKKYSGDLLKVTDYCRALLVVKDFPSLLALLELARDSFGPLIRRVKLSALKTDHKALPGGYRDCKINIELKGHICEIQVHLWPMWTVCGVDGFRHYRHCVEYSTDSFNDPYEALDGLDRKTMAELIVMAEEAVAAMPLDNLEWYQEKYLLDYFAEAGLFLNHGLEAWAEVTLRRLIQLRMDSPDIGAGHHETLILQKYLERALRAQKKTKEADELAQILKEAESLKQKEATDAESSLWDSMVTAPTDALDMIMDPNKKEREEEENLKKEVKASKRQWRKIRQERFAFLDSNSAVPRQQSAGQTSEQGGISATQ